MASGHDDAYYKLVVTLFHFRLSLNELTKVTEGIEYRTPFFNCDKKIAFQDELPQSLADCSAQRVAYLLTPGQDTTKLRNHCHLILVILSCQPSSLTRPVLTLFCSVSFKLNHKSLVSRGEANLCTLHHFLDVWTLCS